MVYKDKDTSNQLLWSCESDSIYLAESKKLKSRLGSWKKSSVKIIQWILPSFLQNQLSPSTLKPLKLHQTSYLDGLRGVASLIVFMGHYTEENIGWYSEPYGLYEDGAASSPLQLPFIRVIHSARPMVHIFYVISGLVLSYKPLIYIHSQQFLALQHCLSSSVFKRGIRLFIPSFITLFITVLAVGSGISESRYTYVNGDFLYHFGNFFHVCWELMKSSWTIDCLEISIPLYNPEYNPALWSIPVEYSQSLILFITILGLSRCIYMIRLVLHFIIMWYSFRSGKIFTVEFLGGSLIAELILTQGRSISTSLESPKMDPLYDVQLENQPGKGFHKSCIRQSLVQVFWMLNIIIALFISSWTNEHFDEVWGISFLSRNTPEPYDIRNGAKVWYCLAAFQIVIACTQLSWLKKLLNMSIPQYLGRISFPLYLIHNFCLTILEPRFVPIFEKIASKNSFWGRHFFWALGLLIYLPIIIVVSDIFWRVVDIPSVKFAHLLESKCMVEKTS